MALTLGQQLDEIQTSLSSARKAISSKIGDKEIQRSYNMLLKEKNEILEKIDTFGSDYIEGVSTSQKKSFTRINFV